MWWPRGIHNNRQFDGGCCGADIFLVYRESARNAIPRVVLDDTETHRDRHRATLLYSMGIGGMDAEGERVAEEIQRIVVLPVVVRAAVHIGADDRFHIPSRRGQLGEHSVAGSGVAAVLRCAVWFRALAGRTLWRQDQRGAAVGAEEHRNGNMDGQLLPDAAGIGFHGILLGVSECMEQLADVGSRQKTKR